MKKRNIYSVIGIILLVAILTTVTVYAKVFRSSWVENKMKNGYTETDAYNIMGIMYLSGENVSSFVQQKYEKLGDWDLVAKSYGVDLEKLHKFVATQERVVRDTEIPDSIYREMIKEGMTDEECKEFAKGTNVAGMDIETTWSAHKEGKTINDLIKESTELKNAKSQAATDLAFGKITAKEYTSKMEELAPDMTISEILTFATETANGWMRMRKATSGITDEEIELAKKAGLKGTAGFLEACRMKDAEKISKLTFSQMITEVEKGKSVDDILNNNLSQEKLDAARKASGATEGTE